MIKRIQIENFKSFGKVDIEPHPGVNLLIGPNSSGKSNFLEALQTVNKDPVTNVERNLQPWSNCINKNFNTDFFTLQCEFARDQGLVLKSGKQVLSRRILFKDQMYLTVFHGYEENLVFQKRHFNSDLTFGAESGSINESLETDFIFFADYERSFCQYLRPDIASVRKDFNEVHFVSINDDFSNLGALIFNLMTYHFESYVSMCDTLEELTGEFKRVTVPSPKPGIFNLSFDTKNGTSFTVREVSDGIVYFICILAILHQPNPPKVILLEEPENGIHPRRLSEIISLIWKLAEEKGVQFFITTHSPIILDQFSEYPECVWVFDKKEGVTEIQNVEKIIEKKHAFAKANGLPELDYTAELSENWLWGLLDGVPPVTQI